MLPMALDYQEICRAILGLDKSIRYVGFADHLGSLLETVYREGLVPLSSKEDSAKYTERAIYLTGAASGGFNPKVGKMQYVVGRYENLIRATIPVVSESFDKFYLMVSLDVGSDYVRIIEDKILDFIKKNKRIFD